MGLLSSDLSFHLILFPIIVGNVLELVSECIFLKLMNQ